MTRTLYNNHPIHSTKKEKTDYKMGENIRIQNSLLFNICHFQSIPIVHKSNDVFD